MTHFPYIEVNYWEGGHLVYILYSNKYDIAVETQLEKSDSVLSHEGVNQELFHRVNGVTQCKTE